MASQPNTYSDGGLVRGSVLVAIADSANTSNTNNYIFKDLKPDAPVRSAYEYDQNGQPFASSHVRDFKKFSGTVMAINTTNAPAQMVKFTADLGLGSTSYIILQMSKPQTTEGLKSWQFDGTEVIN